MSNKAFPNDWCTIRLGDVCRKAALANPQKKTDWLFRYVDVSGVSNEAFQIVETKKLMGREAPSRARKLIETDDVIFATVRPTLRRVALIPHELNGQICSTGYCVIKANRENLEPAYAYYYLLTDHVNSQVENLQKGATYPAINDSDLFDLLIPLPPLPEQRAIARALRSVQEAKEARRRELALERERKAALMQHLFTHGTRGEPTKQTEIGEMPESWEVVKLGEMALDIGSGVTPKGGEKFYLKSGIPLIRSQNVLMNRLSIDEVAYISKETHMAMIRSAIQPGDVLLNITGASIGRVAYVPDYLKVANVNQHVCRIRLKGDVAPEFVSFYLAFHKGQSQIMGFQFGTTRQGLNYGNVKALRIPLPALTEQNKITNTLKACDAKLAVLERELALLDEFFRAMLEELMTGRLSAKPLIETIS